MRLSVIIANHNYRNFVGAAIVSALSIDWPDTEVIVVDDESTDDSRAVIAAYGNRVAAFFRAKSHQLGAHKFGVERSTGDIVILLDSDDLLEPDVMREIAKVWRPGVSKVQYRMNLISADGTQLGTAIPQFPPRDNPQRLRRTYLRTMAYTTPPGSGNAYSRDFARQAFAMVSATMRISDAPLLTLAPLLGDVLTIRKPLGRYRVHSSNDGALSSLDATKFRNRLVQDVEQARLFSAVAQARQVRVRRDPLSRSLPHLQYRFASYVAEPEAHPFPKDTLPNLVYRLAASAAVYPQLRLRERGILLGWVIICALVPRALQQSLLLWRFAPLARPAMLKSLLGAFSSLKSPVLRAAPDLEARR